MTKIIKADSINCINTTPIKWAIASESGFQLWINRNFAIEFQKDNPYLALADFHRLNPSFMRVGEKGDLLINRESLFAVTSFEGKVTIVYNDLSTDEINMGVSDYHVKPFDAVKANGKPQGS